MHVLNVLIRSFVLCGSRLECQDVILIFFSGVKTPGAITERNYFEALHCIKNVTLKQFYKRY